MGAPRAQDKEDSRETRRTAGDSGSFSSKASANALVNLSTAGVRGAERAIGASCGNEGSAVTTVKFSAKAGGSGSEMRILRRVDLAGLVPRPHENGTGSPAIFEFSHWISRQGSRIGIGQRGLPRPVRVPPYPCALSRRRPTDA